MSMVKKVKRALKNNKGFSLIELIVVIAIIGILVLLAAPKFIGYTRDADVAAMRADAKILSDAAMLYNLDNEVFPVHTNTTYVDIAIPTDSNGNSFYTVEVAAFGTTNLLEEATTIKESALSEYVKNIKGDLSHYGLVIDEGDERFGEVLHLTGVTDKENVKHYGLDLKEVKQP